MSEKEKVFYYVNVTHLYISHHVIFFLFVNIIKVQTFMKKKKNQEPISYNFIIYFLLFSKFSKYSDILRFYFKQKI